MKSLPRAMGLIARALALALGVTALFGAAAGLAGGFDFRLDLFANFAPEWLAAGLAAVVLAGLSAPGGARRLGIALGLCAVLASAALMAPEWLRSNPMAAQSAGPRLRLIQFNSWDRNLEPAVVADWISKANPQVVTLEESTPDLRRALKARGFHVFGGMISTAVFSRGLRSSPRVLLPPQDWGHLPDFARAAFLTPGGAPFSVVTVHLNWPNRAANLSQPWELARLLDNQPRARLIVSGDFNLTPWSDTLRRLDRRLNLVRRDQGTPSWPAMRYVAGRLVPLPAILPIDHVYAGPAWRTVSVRRGPRLGSDHYPLIVDLTLTSDGLCPPGAPC